MRKLGIVSSVSENVGRGVGQKSRLDPDDMEMFARRQHAECNSEFPAIWRRECIAPVRPLVRVCENRSTRPAIGLKKFCELRIAENLGLITEVQPNSAD